MEQKKSLSSILILCVIGAVLAGLTVFLGSAFHSSGTATVSDSRRIVGNWQDQSTQLTIAFTDDGNFQMSGSTVATYTVNQDTQTIHLVYTEAYGGNEVDRSYTFIDDNTLQMVDNSEAHTYLRNQ